MLVNYCRAKCPIRPRCKKIIINGGSPLLLINKKMPEFCGGIKWSGYQAIKHTFIGRDDYNLLSL